MRYIELLEIAGIVCDEYCKYPHIYDEDNEEQPRAESEICKNCPLNKLLEVARDDIT